MLFLYFIYLVFKFSVSYNLQNLKDWKSSIFNSTNCSQMSSYVKLAVIFIPLFSFLTQENIFITFVWNIIEWQRMIQVMLSNTQALFMCTRWICCCPWNTKWNFFPVWVQYQLVVDPGTGVIPSTNIQKPLSDASSWLPLIKSKTSFTSSIDSKLANTMLYALQAPCAAIQSSLK